MRLNFDIQMGLCLDYQLGTFDSRALCKIPSDYLRHGVTSHPSNHINVNPARRTLPPAPCVGLISNREKVPSAQVFLWTI